MTTYKAAVIGEKEAAAGFAALGLTVFADTPDDETAALIKRLADNGFAIIFISERAAMYEPTAAIIDEFRDKLVPAIILIPSANSNSKEGMRRLHQAVEKAVGSDILKQKDGA